MSARPQNIGIKAIEVYFPSQCVDQSELEKFDGVSEGKYTIGLGQTKMSFCDDREDIYSMALTTLSSLISKYNIDKNNVGRLEVGTETLLDKSKSVKSVLMQLFAPENTNIEGIDTVNACYGGTNAVFNSINWVESSAWDGRDAIVVCGDIALYAKGAARPTGGAGCVAMLIGPDAPIVFEPGLRGSYITHAYDFFKPDLTSEYPVVDGHFSLKCYTEAVDACYKAYDAREKTLKEKAQNGSNGTAQDDSKTPLDRFDYILYHAPTCKLVQKSFGRMLYNDYLANPSHPAFAEVAPELRDLSYDQSLTDKSVEKTFMGLTKKRYAERVRPGLDVATLCGNMYTATVYAGLASLISNVKFDPAEAKRVGIFSYGSGLAASMYSAKIVGDVSYMVEKLDLHNRLNGRTVLPPQAYDDMCVLREHAHLKKNFKPSGKTETLYPKTYYLSEVDDMFRRQYEVKA
ncbi:hydroxymethylglutaryl-CoA synthase [Aspergillus melleus]|uniref:hydroxymethylglutaryl-CoA synthase n=1 Tax=Aspergillus melleus TaxID=138277 RepID=UPI001E8D70EB|nr:3-hydroxy-3-methylglutaryl coenzyme A synthase [Aspergillus melleus]KAH8423817.1 3-hydroxy-3-methylglutaryl coenzyme A synthase [Aspergillus melleus]